MVLIQIKLNSKYCNKSTKTEYRLKLIKLPIISNIASENKCIECDQRFNY